MTHCSCLRWLDLAGGCDHRIKGRKRLYNPFVWVNSHLLPALCTEVVGIVAHFHAEWNKGTAKTAEQTAAECCHSVKGLASRRGIRDTRMCLVSNLPCGTSAFLLDSCHGLLAAERTDDQAWLLAKSLQLGNSLDNSTLTRWNNCSRCGWLPYGLLRWGRC